MANVLYPKGKKKFLDGDIDLLNDTIMATLIDLADYTYDADDEFYSDVAAAAKVAEIELATGKTTTGGQFNADDVTWLNVTGDTCEAVIIWKDTGDDATSALIAFIDDDESGLPVTPNGGNITSQWDASPEYIFAI